MFCSIGHIWDMKWSEFKIKIIIWDHIDPMYLLTMIKNIYLKTDVAGYHISINLLVNLLKIILSNIDNLL